MTDDNHVELKALCQTVRAVLASEPLLVWDSLLDREILIERYVCPLNTLHLPEITRPIIVVQFAGKKATQIDSAKNTISYPSMTTVIPGITSSQWDAMGMFDFAIIYLSGNLLSQLRKALGGEHEPLMLVDSLTGALLKQVVMLLNDNKPDEKADYMNALLAAFCQHLYYGVSKPVLNTNLDLSRSSINYVNAAINFIDGHLATPLHSELIAAQVGLRPSHFRKLFRQIIGTSLHQYVIQLRVERATKLLRTSSLTLSNIAEEVGFSDQSHMTNSFRKHLDMTPSQVRRT